MSKRNISSQDKINAVKRYLDGLTSQRILANEFGISQASVQQWITNYESIGKDVFLMESYKHYSAELKRRAVLDYLSGKGSQTDICKKYGIHVKSKLQTWIKKYTGHEELKSSGTGDTVIMTKGRKTTFDKRVEIASYCIANNHNYSETAEKFNVSYQQARNYTIKYERYGVLRICRKKDIKSTTTYSNNACTRQAANPQFIAENILNREFYADVPNEKWLTDVTEFKYYIGTEKHKVYFSAILDLYDRRIVAYVVRDKNIIMHLYWIRLIKQ